MSKLTEKGRKPITLHIPEKANFLFFHMRQIRWLKKFVAFSKELAEINYVHTRGAKKYSEYQLKLSFLDMIFFHEIDTYKFFVKNLDGMSKRAVVRND